MQQQEAYMFGKNKDTALGHEQELPSSQAPKGELIERSVAAQPAAPAPQQEMSSSLSSGMTVIGKLVGEGAVKIFGRIEGELQASSIVICEGAQVDGNVVAKELTIAGRVKGTIHAVRVKLQGAAVVEGDIFHRSLAIEENARFEGMSRREDSLTDKPSSALTEKQSGAPTNGSKSQSPAPAQNGGPAARETYTRSAT
jgi:cytoskeletal protein CcmA (bactofilin family)